MGVSQKSWLFWAKTPERFGSRANRPEDAGIWLSLAQHMRDSADVGQVLFEQWLAPSVQDRLVQLAGGWDRACSLVSWLAGTHDIGKAELHFATQLVRDPDRSYLSNRIIDAFSIENRHLDPNRRLPHSHNSDLIIFNWLTERFSGVSSGVASSMTSIAGCHHGKPSGLGESSRKTGSSEQYWLQSHGSEWSNSWDELIGDIADRTDAFGALEYVLANGGIGVSDQLLLSGLVTMADWLASNQSLFELTYSGKHQSESSRAQGALQRLGLTRTWRPETVDSVPYKERFRWDEGARLRPVQEAAINAAQEGVGPTLMIIEEEMGQGKTEAALLVAEILAAKNGAGGVVFALPTMATTDAMFSRFQRWVESVNEGADEQHSLFLGHSRARLNSDFENLVRRTSSVDSFSNQGESIIAHQWFSGKKGLLAEFAVTTIDQILMAALATKHVTLRHLGLAGKIVIVDEAHSYDVYTSSYLERMLAWLGAQGASVIVLSATLPKASRQKLVEAYKDSMNLPMKSLDSDPMNEDDFLAWLSSVTDAVEVEEEPEGDDSVPYPRITIVDGDNVREHSVTQRQAHRRVLVDLVPDDLSELSNLVSDPREQGGVVGIICNTVRRAQDVYEHLLNQDFPSVELIHSQFTALDRARREQLLVDRLGPGAARGTGRPYFHIVVGTQILEQSLDIDFDLLITDLAPMDSILQRAGRLHRHQRPPSDRPDGLQPPRIILRGLDASGEVPGFDSGAVSIYGRRVLLSTFAILRPRVGSQICLTHQLEDLVEQTYSEEFVVPELWTEEYQAAVEFERESIAKSQKRAEVFQLRLPNDSRGSMNVVLERMMKTDAARSETTAASHVRDIEPGLEALLVVSRDGYLEPLPWLVPSHLEGVRLSETEVPPRELAEIIAASVVRLPRWLVRHVGEIDQAIDELEKFGVLAWQTDFRLKGQLVIRLDGNLVGKLLGRSFTYDASIGLSEIKDPQKIKMQDERMGEWEDQDELELIDDDWSYGGEYETGV